MRNSFAARSSATWFRPGSAFGFALDFALDFALGFAFR